MRLRSFASASRAAAAWMVVALGILAAPGARAAPLEFSLDQTAVSVDAGSTLSFTGVITNRTGATLSSTDLFVNFGSYDFTALTPVQTLGQVPFTIPNFTFTSSVALFDVEVSSTAVAGSTSFQVFLQDVSGNVTDPIEVDLTIIAVPEPATAAMFAAAFAVCWGARRAAGRRSGRRNSRRTAPSSHTHA